MGGGGSLKGLYFYFINMKRVSSTGCAPTGQPGGMVLYGWLVGRSGQLGGHRATQV